MVFVSVLITKNPRHTEVVVKDILLLTKKLKNYVEMKQFIRKICFWILDKIKTQKKVTPESQVLAEQECVINGHIWKSKLHKNEGPYEVKTKDRVYCVRCGQKYHEHVYDNSVKTTD